MNAVRRLRILLCAAAVCALVSCDAALGPRADMPVFDPPPDLPVPSGTVVRASSPSPTATIHYRLDNTLRTASSPVFPVEGITLQETTTILAICVERGFRYSYPAYGSYQIEPPTEP